MNAALWAMVGCFLAGIGARDQMVVAGLTARLGRHPGLLLLGLLTAALASAAAAWASGEIAAQMPYSARLVLACLALAAGGIESLVVKPRVTPKEPTRSLFAAGLALAIQQAADSARFLVFAIALLTDFPLAAAVGGAVGTGFALLLGWLAAGAMLKAGSGMIALRRAGGGLLLLAAGLMALCLLIPTLGDR